MITDIIVGLQHGDEGKGKVINWLCRNNNLPDNYDFCVRFNGGPNAGHTIYLDKTKVVLHQIPIGIVYGIKSLIGPACVLDIKKLLEEKAQLEDAGILNVEQNLFISYNTHIIETYHIEEDIKTDKIGSTGSGIRPTYRDKFNRRGVRVCDFIKNKSLLEGFNIVDPYELLHRVPNSRILCEGAQGFELDIDWGSYPYVTSSNCLSGFCCTAGVPPNTVQNVYGISKIYETYVGKKQFQPNDIIFEQLQRLGNEFGATTGRKRQCNWLNLRRLIRAIYVNGVTHLIINKCDIINELNVYKIYDESDNLLTFSSFEEMKSYIINIFQNIHFIKDVIFSFSKTQV